MAKIYMLRAAPSVGCWPSSTVAFLLHVYFQLPLSVHQPRVPVDPIGSSSILILFPFLLLFSSILRIYHSCRLCLVPPDKLKVRIDKFSFRVVKNQVPNTPKKPLKLICFIT